MSSIEDNLREEERVAADLRAAGFDVDVIPELHGQPGLRRAVPVLLDWLDRAESTGVRQAIVRALAIKEARPAAARPLIAWFTRVQDDSGMGVRWNIGNTLSVVADESVFEEIVALVREPRWGLARQMPVAELSRRMRGRGDEVHAVLRALLPDPDVGGHAALGLRRLGRREALADLEAFVDDPRPLVRREARKAVAELARLGPPPGSSI